MLLEQFDHEKLQREAAGHPTVEQLLDDYARAISAARVYDVAERTPLEYARGLSQRLGNDLWIKREDLQSVFSFKLRGAYNKVAALPESKRARGVICASAGNHAQGVALAGSRLNIPATIVMPQTTPGIKVESVRALGGQVVLHGDSFDEASEHAHALAVQQELTYIPPYDDFEVIAGQGTVGMEILEQLAESGLDTVDAIFVPVGGGGLLAGIAAWVKKLRPEIRIVGVEAEDSACLYHAMEAGERVVLNQVGLFADGVAVRQIGEEPFRVVRHLLDAMVLVTVDEMCAAISDIFRDNRSLAEPAGALAVAGAKRYAEMTGQRGKRYVAIESGANVNFDRLRHIAERAELGEQREALLAVTIPERPGSFRKFCELLGRRGITEFNYRYASQRKAHIFAGVQLSGGNAEKQQLLEVLAGHDYPVVDMSDNEMAKVHVRYMVGGRSEHVQDEILFRFEFPERPGALLQFLNSIGERWNISLFHYRNHGSAYGRVLVGLQVPVNERADCRASLDALHYVYEEETDNPAYLFFLDSPEESV